MFKFKKKKENPVEKNGGEKPSPEEMYHDLRNMALGVEASQLSVEPGNECPVYGAVIDLCLGDNTATMISMLDGTVSLYYGTGGGIIGVGERYEEVREQGFSLLANAVQLLGYFDVTDNYSLPEEDGACHAFFLTDDGVYKAAFHMDRDDEGDEYDFLNGFIQNLLTSIRVSTEGI